MKGTVELKGRTVPFELTYKRVKNINIRIRSDGTVGVSAPRGVPGSYVEGLLVQRADFILRTLDRFQDMEQRAPRDPDYGQGDTLYLLGAPHRIILVQGARARVERSDGVVAVTLRDPSDPEARKRAVQDYLRNCCLEVTSGLIRQAGQRMEALGIPQPEIRVRSMTSRWGVCRPSAKRVTFARQLVEAPLPCVEYVVWHELIHFLHGDHSKAFYADLAAVLPDWRQRRQVLNSCSYRDL